MPEHNSRMPPLVFINYRRSDSQQAATGLYVQLRARIGTASVFMDRSGISAGDIWSDRLREVMSRATVVLVLIGSNWLRTADEYGRRRLDIDDDWVRDELLTAINSRKSVIPVLLGSQTQMPPPQALPKCLEALSGYQAYGLRDDRWDADLNDLIRLLGEQHGFRDADRKIVLPEPVIRIQPLTQAELDNELKTLPGWEPVESLVPGDYPKSRQELRKVYVFGSFKAAISFMQTGVAAINKEQHHPRWENQWRTVTVYLTTWDIGFRISPLDIKLARLLDTIYNPERTVS
jgi:pterin-4a-carbinolamine dehydratase